MANSIKKKIAKIQNQSENYLKNNLNMDQKLEGLGKDEIDFTKKWEMSDLIIKIQNSNLFVNGQYLAIHSPYFKRHLLNDSNESTMKVVELNVDLEAMWDILRIIHLFDEDFKGRVFAAEKQGICSLNRFFMLYKAADLLEISKIQHFCKEALNKMTQDNALIACVKLGMHKNKVFCSLFFEKFQSKLIKSMNASLIKKSISAMAEYKEFILSGQDILEILRIGGYGNFPNKYMYFENKRINNNTPVVPVKIEELKITEVDFTQKWEDGLSDVAIETLSGQLLYANKNYLAIHSSFFKALLFGNFAESQQAIVKVDVDFEIMLKILRIIHLFDQNYKERSYTIEEMMGLYNAADFLEFANIRENYKECIKKMKKEDALIVCIKLGLAEMKTDLLTEMNYAQIGSALQLNANNQDLIFTAQDANIILNNLGYYN